MTAGEGTCFSPEDPDLLLATRARAACQERAGSEVDEVLSVKQVDIRHGHVDVRGLPAGHRGRHARHARSRPAATW